MNTILEYPQRGNGGNNAYRGNCSPTLISDLINFFGWENISDYMCGSGTTRDAAEKCRITSRCYDLHSGFNLLTDDIKERNEAIFWHPPYWDIIKYSNNMYSAAEVYKKYGYNPLEWDLSQITKWEDFVNKMNYCCVKQFSSIEKGGRMAILVGDIKKKGKLYSMILELQKPGTIENILIKKQFNCLSNYKSYNNKFIRINHEYVLILRKDNPIIYQLQFTKKVEQSILNLEKITWKDLIASIIEDSISGLSLSEIYETLKSCKRSKSNKYWKEKIRQTLYQYDIFYKDGQRWRIK